MRVAIITLSVLLLTGFAFGDDDSSREKLMGKWQQTDGNGDTKSTWALEGSSDSIHVTNSNGTQTIAEFECNTTGKDCAIKDGGHSSKVSMWFSGPKLVELETKGSKVVKRRFSVTGDGDAMEIETIPIVPAGNDETTHFKRFPSAVAKQ